MEIRTTSKLVTFRHPFHLAGLDGIQPPGTYTMDVEEERLDAMTLVGWRRIGVTLKITRGGTTEYIAIDMQDLREALLRDGDQSTKRPAAGGSAKPAPARNPPSASRPPMTTGPLSFPYSRIFAQGWNAARRSSLTGLADSQKVAAKNPHKTPHERARWDEGFAKGME